MGKSKESKENSIVSKIIQKILDDRPVSNLVKAIDANQEFEIRFGINDGSNSFVPNMGKEAYEKILKSIKKKTDDIKADWVHERSIVMYNTNTNSDYRFMKEYDDDWKCTNIVHMRKSLVDNYDNYNYGMRFSLAQEIKLDENEVSDLTDSEKTKNYFRFRDRCSLDLDKYWRIDLSRTTFIDTMLEDDLRKWMKNLKEDQARLIDDRTMTYVYEIELEYMGKPRAYDNIMEEMGRHLTLIYGTIYSSRDLITKQIRINIFKMMKRVLQNKNAYFHKKPIDAVSIKDISNQVITLEFKHIPIVQNNSYIATEKTDGERMLLYGNKLTTYLLTGSNEIYMMPATKNSSTGEFILDGEYIEYPNGECVLYIFDILIAGSKDVTQIQFPKRQKIAGDIVDGLAYSKDTKFTVVKKIFYEVNPTNFFIKNKNIIETKRKHEIDGIIYTPMSSNYFGNNYKWKMVHTADFVIRRRAKEPTVYDLYIKMTRNDIAQQQRVSGAEIEFPKNYEKMFPNIDINRDNHFPMIFNPTNNADGEKFGYTEIPDKKFRNLELEDDMVVEFRWSLNREKWIPIRPRHDRTDLYHDPLNKTYFGNSWMNVIAIYRTIMFPITTEMMIGVEPIPTTYWQVGDKKLIRPMLQFHSHLKIGLYNDYTKNADHILELGGGQANDFKKWQGSHIKNVTLIDLDPSAIQEGINRTKFVKDLQIKFIAADVNQDLTMLLKKNKAEVQYDSIVSNFSVHYFTTTKDDVTQLINNVLGLLKSGGYFIFTTFNGEKVFTELQKTNPLILKNKYDQRLFQIEAKYPSSDIKLKHYGQKVEVYVESIGKQHEEGLVNLKYLIEKFLQTDEMQLIENSSFVDRMDTYSSRNDMSPAEKKFSGMYNVVVLQKK